MRTRPHRTGLLLLAILVVLIAAGWGLWYVTIGRGPLAGDRSHDFGVVPIPKQVATARHVFELTNRTDETITIKSVHSSCGCAAAKPDRMELEPGEPTEFKAALSLNKTGLKKAHITLVLNDDRIVTLHLRAVGRKEHVLSHNEGRLRDGGLPVSATRATIITLFAEIIDNDDPPAKLEWAAPRGVEVSVTEWELRLQRRRATREPARWLAQIKIQPVDHPLAEDAALVIDYPPDERLTIPLRRISVPGRDEDDDRSGADAESPPDVPGADQEPESAS